jgi:GNAT superfamily N-acetyltransferase
MFTYYLGREQVDAYLHELVQRLAKCDPIPTVWCPLTDSGLALVRPMMDLVKAYAPQMIPLVSVLGIAVEKDGSLQFDQGDPTKDLPGKHVLLLDASVHSGRTMLRALQAIRGFGALGICTYALVLKKSGQIVPSLWGVMIDDRDRAYFQLDSVPNNRLTTHFNESHPYAYLRRLAEADDAKPPLVTGLASLDRATWGDRHYDMLESPDGKCTYLLETSGGTAGYLTIHFADHAVCIDEVALAQNEQGHGYGGVLMRFAETLARQNDCRGVRLNAIKDRVPWYEKLGYGSVPGRPCLHVEAEEYHPMEKLLLHHLPATDD